MVVVKKASWELMRIGRGRYGKRKMKINKQRTVKADLDGSSFDLNQNSKILKSDWLSTALFQP